jgi:hypothetical protein
MFYCCGSTCVIYATVRVFHRRMEAVATIYFADGSWVTEQRPLRPAPEGSGNKDNWFS